jgi:uncharacterized repeat protein (TIGR02543 family)
MNDGTGTAYAVKTVTPPAATVTGFPANPARTGYAFTGWNTQANGSGSVFTASTTVSGNITVYAQWTEVPEGSYTVTFLLNGGTEAAYAVKSVTPPAISVTDFPDAPVRTGYAFGGWYTEPEGGGTAFTASTTVSGNITVYARWNSYSYTVSFDDGDGNTVIRTVSSPAATIDPLPAAPPDKTGYSFGGWYTEPDGEGSEFTASTTVSGNITLYAKWIGKTYTVSFDTNGGDTQADPATKTVAGPAITIDTLPTPPAKTDYFFGGWNTQADGSGTPFTTLTTVSGDIRVYAQWVDKQLGITLITLDPDAGEGAFTQTSFTLSKSAAESQSLTLTGTGYTNPRWYVDDNLKGTGNSVTIKAVGYGAGGHILTLIISKGGASWSREITFTVTN